jgi:uncharacterized protein YndB with AHSA1/START domain
MTAPVMTLTRTFAATPAQVWAAWTDPAILPRWFGPAGFTCTTHDIDIREGGQWRFDMVGAMGGQVMTFPNRHRYLRLIPSARIDLLMDDGTDDAEPFQVTVTLTAEGAGTRLTQATTFPNVASWQAARDMGAEALGMTTLAKLAAIVEA